MRSTALIWFIFLALASFLSAQRTPYFYASVPGKEDTEFRFYSPKLTKANGRLIFCARVENSTSMEWIELDLWGSVNEVKFDIPLPENFPPESTHDFCVPIEKPGFWINDQLTSVSFWVKRGYWRMSLEEIDTAFSVASQSTYKDAVKYQLNWVRNNVLHKAILDAEKALETIEIQRQMDEYEKRQKEQAQQELRDIELRKFIEKRCQALNKRIAKKRISDLTVEESDQREACKLAGW